MMIGGDEGRTEFLRDSAKAGTGRKGGEETSQNAIGIPFLIIE